MIPLEQQVTSLEISQRLKELGVSQESIYFWRSVSNNTAPEPENWYYSHYLVVSREKVPEQFNNARLRFCSAFTVAELGEMLREEESELPTYLSSTKEWVAVYETTLIGGADTEADARGKMLIYLLENKLITL